VQPTQYTIIVRGRLGERFAAAFPGASLLPGPDHTRLDTGFLDQSQLHGLLEQLRSFAIELISVQETATTRNATEGDQP
jgi:hypothetical protein